MPDKEQVIKSVNYLLASRLLREQDQNWVPSKIFSLYCVPTSLRIAVNHFYDVFGVRKLLKHFQDPSSYIYSYPKLQNLRYNHEVRPRYFRLHEPNHILPLHLPSVLWLLWFSYQKLVRYNSLRLRLKPKLVPRPLRQF